MAKKTSNKPDYVVGNWLVFRERGHIYKKKYSAETYDQDVQNFKEYRSFKNPKQTKSYGKSYTFGTGTTVRYRKYDGKSQRGKGVKNETRYSYYQIYCEGYAVIKGKRREIRASSDAYPIGEPKEVAVKQATDRFYFIASHNYLYEENEKKSYSELTPKQQLGFADNYHTDDVVLENIYITYKR